MLCMMTLMGSWIMMQITLAFLDQKKKIKVKHLKYSKDNDSFEFDEYTLCLQAAAVWGRLDCLNEYVAISYALWR